MSRRSRAVRAAVVTAAAGGLLLSGCAQQGTGTPVAHRDTLAAPQATVTPTPAPTHDTANVPVRHPPTTLPPGDPGLDAPSVPDPGRPQEGPEHEEHARTVVPEEALLDAQTVSGVLGGDWSRSGGEPLDCLAGGSWVAQGSSAFETADGHLLLTVATHRSHEAADRAVREQLAALRRCGWTGRHAPRLGTASAAAVQTDAGQSAVVVSAEGVTVTLVGSGSATANHRRWVAMVDLALGSSCAAAAEGCHDLYPAESAE